MKNKGQELVEFVLIAALLFVAGLAAYYVFGDKIAAFFNGSSSVSKHATTQPGNIINKDIQSKYVPDWKTNINAGGQLGGTTTSPVSQCDGGTCTIDFGEFILQGVPENLPAFVQTSGTAGGTESLLSMIEQIAQQLEDQGDSTGSKEYRDLANMGHFMVEMQKQIEFTGKECLSGGTKQSEYIAESQCFKNKMNNSSKTFELPDDLKPLLPDYGQYSSGDLMLVAAYNLSFKEPTTSYMRDYKGITHDPDRDLSAAFNKLYNQIMQNSSYPDSLKNVTEQLKNTIVSVTQSQVSQSDRFYYGGKCGAEPSCCIGSSVDTYILHPQTSTNTNIKSVLICVAGKNRDDAQKCK